MGNKAHTKMVARVMRAKSLGEWGFESSRPYNDKCNAEFFDILVQNKKNEIQEVGASPDGDADLRTADRVKSALLPPCANGRFRRVWLASSGAWRIEYMSLPIPLSASDAWPRGGWGLCWQGESIGAQLPFSLCACPCPCIRRLGTDHAADALPPGAISVLTGIRTGAISFYIKY